MEKSFFSFLGGGIWPLKKPQKTLILGLKNLNSKEFFLKNYLKINNLIF